MEVTTPSHSVVREFMELTFANELELVRDGKDFRRKYGPEIDKLFGRCERYVSAPAFDCYRETFS
jgi:hypothetical protein